MTAWITFGPETNPVLPQLDTNFGILAGFSSIPCTASGANAITLTIIQSGLSVASYANFNSYAFTAASNSTDAVTLTQGGVGFLPVYLPSGVQAGSGTFTAGDYIVVDYIAALNSGAGGWMVVSAPAIGSPSQMLNQIGTTQGSILYRGASAWTALTPGTSGFFLQSQGASANPQWAQISSVATYRSIVITSSGTAVLPATVSTTTQIKITAVGAGGNGGNASTATGASGGGGGSGQVCIGVFSGFTAGQSITASIGSGGSSANTTVSYAAATIMTAPYGTQGQNSTSATICAGGNASIGTIAAGGGLTLVATISLASGNCGQIGTGATIGGAGGGNPYGYGGAGGQGNQNGFPALGYGAGGGGASSTGSSETGGAGAPGVVILEWIG